MLNPSLLGFQPASAFSGTYNWADGSQTGDVRRKAFNISAIDGRNQYVQAGFSFTRKAEYDAFHLVLAKRVLPWLSFGATGKRFGFTREAFIYPGVNRSGMDAGVSMSVAVPPKLISLPLQFGVTADNLTNGRSTEAMFGPRQFGFGAKATFTETLMLYGDVVQLRPRGAAAYAMYYGATELSLGSDLYARVGAFRGRDRGWSFGGGWIGPRMGIHYGYQNQLALNATRGFQHAMSVDLFM